jgi:uncharacterized protein YjbJ (UPF0337 family)
MNWDVIEGKWSQLKGSARQQWGKLTNDDLELIAGKRDKLVGKLQERYGYLKDEAEQQVDEWIQSAGATKKNESTTRSHIQQ